jgi:hypothetical protein
VSRRISVPAAEELFRATQPLRAVGDGGGADGDVGGRERLRAVPDSATIEATVEPATAEPQRRSSGRERHPEKITVYVSADELLELEQARLTLRARHGLAVDRGRLVREAVAAVLEEFEALGEDSTLVRRLRLA